MTITDIAQITTVAQFNTLMTEIYAKADAAIDAKYTREDDQYPCGFAWTKIVIDGRSKIGKIVAK